MSNKILVYMYDLKEKYLCGTCLNGDFANHMKAGMCNKIREENGQFKILLKNDEINELKKNCKFYEFHEDSVYLDEKQQLIKQLLYTDVSEEKVNKCRDILNGD